MKAPTCKHCGQPTLGELVCTLTGNCYICEHPDWFMQEYPRNIQRDFHSTPMRRAPDVIKAMKLATKLKNLLQCNSSDILDVWEVVQYAQLRYRNAEWGAVVRLDGVVHQVYSIISPAECLQYDNWVRGAANEAGHISVWPWYPFEGHHANAR